MEALMEFSDLIAQNPVVFSNKIAWLCSRCPPPDSHQFTLSQIHALLATARFLSKSPQWIGRHIDAEHALNPQTLVLSFLRSISSRSTLFPSSLSQDFISSFLCDLLGYITVATELSQEFAADAGAVVGEALIVILKNERATDISPETVKAFLSAASRHCPPVPPGQVDRLVSCILDQLFVAVTETTPSSKWKSKEYKDDASTDDETSSHEIAFASPNSSVAGRSCVDQLGVHFGCGDRAVSQNSAAALEEESMEALEKKYVAFKLFTHMLEKSHVTAQHREQIRSVAAKEVKLLPAFLKLRKGEWMEQGPSLITRVTLKLSICQAATEVLLKCLLFSDSDRKNSKIILRGALAMLLDAAESCALSSCRKLRSCEDLFYSLLRVITQVAVTRGGQFLRIMLIRLKPLILGICAQIDTWNRDVGSMFDTVVKICCEIIEFGWTKDRAAADTFIMGLLSNLRGHNDYEEQDKKDMPKAPLLELNIINLLAELSVSCNKWELVDMMLPFFIESLEEGDASSPGQLRLSFLDAISRMASLGFEKSYREAVVLMTRSYLDKLSGTGSSEYKSVPPESIAERVEILPEGFLRIASGLKITKLRTDYRQRLLSLCSDVGLAAESKSGRSGADFLGPLLAAVGEICRDFDPTSDVEPSLLKLFRNLWFYIVLFGLAPPIQTNHSPSKSLSTSLNSLGSISALALQAVAGPYMWNSQWSLAVQRIAQGTPPLVVKSVKWLEDELELNALHNPGSRHSSNNEKAAVAQRAALSAALGGRVEVVAMSPISGVKATYLLAVAFLEIVRFKYNGGVINRDSDKASSGSAFGCVFEYLKTPNLLPGVFQCLMATAQRAFESAVEWLDERVSEIGSKADLCGFVLCTHACFLIKGISQQEDHIRDISVSLLSTLKDKFPQIMWNSSCLNSLFTVHGNPSSALANDPAWILMVRGLHQNIVREWIINALSYAPCTTQGLLQEQLRKLSASQTPEQATNVVSLLSEIRLGTSRNNFWVGVRTANIPAVMGAAVAASGANLKATDCFSLEVLSTCIASATVKSNHSGEIAGMKRLYTSIGGFHTGNLPLGSFRGLHLPNSGGGIISQQPLSEHETFSEILLNKFVHSLQQFVNLYEKCEMLDKSQFRETCSQATAFLLSNMDSNSGSSLEGFSHLLHLLCWCPAYISTPEAMETGLFIWTWIVSAMPQLGSLVLAELVDAWLWTIDMKRGLFAYEIEHAGPASKLRPHLSPGQPEDVPERDPVEAIIAHRLWLGFFFDRFEVIKYDSVEQLLLLDRMLQGTMRSPSHFTHHPAAVGCFFTAMLLGLKFCRYQSQLISQNCRAALQLLEDRVYRASLSWFSHEPKWYGAGCKGFAQSEAESVAMYVHHLMNCCVDVLPSDSMVRPAEGESPVSNMLQFDHHHPVWGYMESYAVGLEKRRQLLLMLCQHEADRLDVWANPTNCREITSSRPKVNSDKWIDYAKTAFSVDPAIAFCVVSRFPAVTALKAEITHLVHLHIANLHTLPGALPFFVTPKLVDENSVLLQQLPHWAACSITQALEYLTPQYKGHPRVMAYVLRVLESYPPEDVTFFMPQLVQALRYDDKKLVERYLLGAALRSNIFAHILIWHLQGESSPSGHGKDTNIKNNYFQALLPIFRQSIIDNFSSEAREMFQRVFDFWDKVTSISGLLYPLPKDERRVGIKRELEKIEVTGDDIYLPTAPNRLVRGIQLDSGIPLQSAAKVPIMITFNVVDRDGDPYDIKPQACIFKVGDDCRQDVLALQVISLLRDIFDAIGLDLYLFPYGVLPTGPERGIIEVVPNARSRSQMGETTDGGLYEIFQQDFGPLGSASFEAARENFIISSAGYAVASLLLQPKDRHNGNLLFDNAGRLVHIDFGFIFEISPGGNMRFESAQFKLSHEMTQLLDPSGIMKSDAWNHFVSLCVKGYLSARQCMDGIINTVLLMVDSGLPCFSRGDPVGNLRKRFHPEMSEREAANFMIHTCSDAYNKWSTAGYDLIQYIQQGIEK